MLGHYQRLLQLRVLQQEMAWDNLVSAQYWALDQHNPLKLLIPTLDQNTTTFLQDAFNFYSMRYDPQFYDSSQSLKQHIRITYDTSKVCIQTQRLKMTPTKNT